MFWFGLLSKFSTSDAVADKITATFTEIKTNKAELNEAGMTFFANPIEGAMITFKKGEDERGQKEIGAQNKLKVVRLPAQGETVTVDCDSSKVPDYVYGYTAKFVNIKAETIIAIVHKDYDTGKIETGKTAIVYNPTKKNLLIASKDGVKKISVEIQGEEDKKDITSGTATLLGGKYAVLTVEEDTEFTVKNEVSQPEGHDSGRKALLGSEDGDEQADLQAEYETIIYKYSVTAPPTFSYTIKTLQEEKTLTRFDLYPRTATITKHTNNVIDLPSAEKDSFVAFELEAPNFDYKKTGEEGKNKKKDIAGKLTFVRVGKDETLKITAKVPEAGDTSAEGQVTDGEGDNHRKALSAPDHTYGYYISLKGFDEDANVLFVRELGDIKFKQNEKIVLCNGYGKAIKLTSQQTFKVIDATNKNGEITSAQGIENLAIDGFVILTLTSDETGTLTVADAAGPAGLKALLQDPDGVSPEKTSTNVLFKYSNTAPTAFFYKLAGKDQEFTEKDAFPAQGGEEGQGDKEEKESETTESESEEKESETTESESEEKESETTESESEEKEENKPEQEPQPEGSDQKGDDSGNSVNVGAIVGGVIGGVAFIAIVAGLVYFFVIRKKHQPVDKESDAPKP